MGLIGNEDKLVLDCYALAEIYSQSPAVFLSMPINEVMLHKRRTIELRAQQAEERNDG